MSANIAALLYLVSGVLFILALRGLSHPESSRQGNQFGMIGMGVAVVTTLLLLGVGSFATWGLIILAIAIGGGIGAYTAKNIPMTAMPELVAAFHSLVGLAAVFVAAAALYAPGAFSICDASGHIKAASLLEMALGAGIGAITFTGSVIAFGKLSGRVSGSPIMLPMRHMINIALFAAIMVSIIWFMASQSTTAFWLIVVLALVLWCSDHHPDRWRRHAGGGVDAELVLRLGCRRNRFHPRQYGLDHYRGTGRFIRCNPVLHHVQRHEPIVHLGDPGRVWRRNCRACNGADGEVRPVKQGSAEDAAFMLKNASSVIIVPGYGMAVAQAQHALRELADELKAAGVSVKYAIHPVAGRMPGHMNVLLAEANVPYDEVFELEDINSEFANTDIVYVIGANDVTNPAAKEDPQSPIYGMPVLEVWNAGTVMFSKRSLASGYAGIDNSLFYRDNTLMLLGDAKKMVEGIVKSMD